MLRRSSAAIVESGASPYVADSFFNAAQFLLQFPHAAQQRRQFGQRRGSPPPGQDVHRGIAADHAVRRHVVGNPALGHDSAVLADGQMPGHPDLAAELHAVAERRAAGQPDLGTHERRAAHVRAVADLDQVVDLGRGADARGPRSRAIDGRVRADLDRVLQLDRTGLRLGHDRPVRQRHVAEAVAAHDHPALQHHAVADRHPLAHDRAGVGREMIADPHVGVHDHVGEEARVRPDLDPVADHRVRPDRGMGADAGGLRNHRGRMNALRRGVRRREPPQHGRNGQFGIVRAQRGERDRRRVGRQNDRGRARIRKFGEVFLVAHEGEIVRAGLVNGLQTGDVDVSISVEFAVQACGDVGQFHGRGSRRSRLRLEGALRQSRSRRPIFRLCGDAGYGMTGGRGVVGISWVDSSAQ